MRGALLFSASFLVASVLMGAERIRSFTSDITVMPDGSLTVCETIVIQAEGRAIKRGIIRELPTDYYTTWGVRYCVSLIIHEVLQDGTAASYHTEYANNGIALYIGDPNRYIPVGIHTYQITYQTWRQLAFYEVHDELYWNVTGNGWEFPIDHVTAKVHLPLGITSDAVQTEAYTGQEGAMHTAYHVAGTTEGIRFVTTQRLRRHEGLTIVVGWPKGFVALPTRFERVCWFIADNILLVWVIVALLLLYGWMMRLWMYLRRANRAGLIIPRFYPPDRMPPSAVGYMTERVWDDKFLAPDIVYLAVQGYLTIEYREDRYIVRRNEQREVSSDGDDSGAYERGLLAELFAQGDTITIVQRAGTVFTAATNSAMRNAITHYGGYLQELSGMGIRWLLTILVVAPLIVWYGTLPLSALFSIVVSIAVGSLALAGMLVQRATYTAQGRRLQDEIDGFRLFLTTTEVERIAMAGSPPTKTPELYERCLPYAMVLGVEKQWTAQFTSLFAAREAAGEPYLPLWYNAATQLSLMNLGHDMASLHRSLNRTISAARMAPGTTSGFSSSSSGGGYSGGGGGGGGGRGW